MSWLTLEGCKDAQDSFTTTIWVTSPPDPYGAKREAAIKQLGERWVCDRARYVQRGDYSQHESHGADVAATWAVYREKLRPSVIIQEAT